MILLHNQFITTGLEHPRQITAKDDGVDLPGRSLSTKENLKVGERKKKEGEWEEILTKYPTDCLYSYLLPYPFVQNT